MMDEKLTSDLIILSREDLLHNALEALEYAKTLNLPPYYDAKTKLGLVIVREELALEVARKHG
jgi:hypothetical protein